MQQQEQAMNSVSKAEMDVFTLEAPQQQHK
jgi:hypothetical protein